MMSCFETYFDTEYEYFSEKQPRLKNKEITLGEFENLMFVIMPIRNNVRLIARLHYTSTQHVTSPVDKI